MTLAGDHFGSPIAEISPNHCCPSDISRQTETFLLAFASCAYTDSHPSLFLLRGNVMRKALAVLLLAALPVIGRAEPDINDTKLLTQPAVSANQVAFVYAEDLWIADLDG